MNEEQQKREGFEVWYRGRYCRRLSDKTASTVLRTNSKGEYDSYHVREAWEVWQAALSAKSVPEQMGSPIQKLMEYLTNILDEDEFNQCDSILAGQGIAAPQPTDDEKISEPPAYGIIDPDYARVFTKARCIAWQYGYAVLMNGSFTRDLDLLLVPWTDQASRSITPQDLIQRICSDCGLQENGHPPTSKPHGRTAYTLLFKEFGDPRFIDISFMPTIASMTGEQG